jgi:FtsP/CotA-like multicopper oxidase with cupredoxin domain
MKPHAPKLEGIAAADSEKFIAGNCIGDPIPYHVIAQDGLTTAVAQRTTVTTLQPGSRADALLLFPAVGDYCVIDASSAPGSSVAGSTVNRQAEPGRLLGKVTVAGGTPVADIEAELKRQLIAAAQRTMPANIRQKVVADLSAGLMLNSFVPHPTIAASEVTGHQDLGFFIDINQKPTMFGVGSDTYAPRPYDPKRIDRTLTLGGVDEWKLQSLFVSHPFHIHVNPFQIVAILDPDGKDVSAPGAVDNYSLDGKHDATPDPQYPGLKGVWKDTLWVKNINPVNDSKNPRGMYTLIVRTRYERYIGEFVLHCHILDHEDQGMMQNVSIEPPAYHDISGGHM